MLLIAGHDHSTGCACGTGANLEAGRGIARLAALRESRGHPAGTRRAGLRRQARMRGRMARAGDNRGRSIRREKFRTDKGGKQSVCGRAPLLDLTACGCAETNPKGCGGSSRTARAPAHYKRMDRVGHQRDGSVRHRAQSRLDGTVATKSRDEKNSLYEKVTAEIQKNYKNTT